MRFLMSTIFVLAICATAHAQTKKATTLIDFEMMTWPEVKQAIEQGKTTALIYNGGTEQRGPQNVNGGHPLMGHATATDIAEKQGGANCPPGIPVFVYKDNCHLAEHIGPTGPLIAS